MSLDTGMAEEQVRRRRSTTLRESENYSCPICHSRAVRRSKRRGFWQTVVLSMFGRYPWVCRECKHHFILSSRKDSSLAPLENGD